jgi:hypothetical protein
MKEIPDAELSKKQSLDNLEKLNLLNQEKEEERICGLIQSAISQGQRSFGIEGEISPKTKKILDSKGYKYSFSCGETNIGW